MGYLAVRWLGQRLAENTGASLGAAGVLVAAGLGLTQASGGWFVVGIVLSGVAVLWAGLTLVAAIVGSTKSGAFRQALGHALREGQTLLQSKPSDAQAEAWGQKVTT